MRPGHSRGLRGSWKSGMRVVNTILVRELANGSEPGKAQATSVPRAGDLPEEGWVSWPPARAGSSSRTD